MQLFAPTDPRPLHLMGIGGAGMSALALIARRRGVTVTGCDLQPRGAGDLTREGVRVDEGHDPSHVVGARAVIHTAAVAADHPELVAARQAGVPVVRRAQALQRVVEGRTVVAVAGTHGKTTTAAMVTQALAEAAADPTGIVGGRVVEWGGNVRFGGDTLYVVEADEYDRAFLELRPSVAVVTNVEADHLECYGSVDALEGAFATFAGRADRVLVGWDDPGARRVAGAVNAPVWRVGTGRGVDIQLHGVRRDPAVSRARLRLPGGARVGLALSVPGLHNLRNAALAVGVALVLGLDAQAAARGLESFRGVGRRFEVVGTARGITVVDDYAHHPTEVRATLGAARQRFPHARLVAVFQPHLYSRTRSLGAEMGQALAGADLVVVTAVYPAREEPLPGVTGEAVAAAARDAGARVLWVPDRRRVPERLGEVLGEGDVVLTMGAGDITEVGPALLDRLAGTAA